LDIQYIKINVSKIVVFNHKFYFCDLEVFFMHPVLTEGASRLAQSVE